MEKTIKVKYADQLIVRRLKQIQEELYESIAKESVDEYYTPIINQLIEEHTKKGGEQHDND